MLSYYQGEASSDHRILKRWLLEFQENLMIQTGRRRTLSHSPVGFIKPTNKFEVYAKNLSRDFMIQKDTAIKKAIHFFFFTNFLNEKTQTNQKIDQETCSLQVVDFSQSLGDLWPALFPQFKLGIIEFRTEKFRKNLCKFRPSSWDYRLDYRLDSGESSRLVIDLLETISVL